MNPFSQKTSPAPTDLDRLLRAAVHIKEDAPTDMPFGFDTRVVALALSRRNGNGAAFGALLRRVALAAGAVIVLATAGAWLEANQDGDEIVAAGDEFAIADSAIQDEVSP
jgi:hypothetical protein